MASSITFAENSRFPIRPWLSRTIAACGDFGTRFGYSPRPMVAGMAFAAVRLCETHTCSDRLQPFPPASAVPSQRHNRRRSDTAERSLLTSIQQKLYSAWFSLRSLLTRSDRLSS